MANGDVYQIRVFQRLADLPDEFLNVFFYRQVSGFDIPNAADVWGVFADDVWDNIRAIQEAGMVTARYTVINVGTPSDYVEGSPASPGTFPDAGFNLPPFVCAAFRAPRAAAGDRYSYKRISGQQTGNIGGDAKFSSAYTPALAAAAVALGLQLEGANGLYEPVQVASGWVLGVTPDVNYALVGNWSYNQFPSHQVTRQDGYYAWVEGSLP